MIDDSWLWSETERVLSYHQKKSDPTPLDALNRLFREHLKGCKDVPSLGRDSCSIRIEKLGWTDLDRLSRKDKETRNPRYKGDPIVAIEFEGKAYLVDGRRRVNQCVFDQSQDTLDVLFVKYKQRTTR